MARSLFYWYLWRKGYWHFSLLPISLLIKKSAKQYMNAFIYSEQDNNNLTYFIDYNLKKIQEAKKEFVDYVNRRSKRIERDERDYVLKDDYTKSKAKLKFNERQLKLLRYFMRKPNEKTNVSQHSHKHSVTKVTAVADLKYLKDNGF